jgi:hypothetical protein
MPTEYDSDRDVQYDDSMEDMWDEEGEDMDFADPGGVSALRAETPDNPRNLPCPDCGEPNRLTPKDAQLGYCCDQCADRNEGHGY